MRLHHALIRQQRGYPRAFTAQVRPPHQPCTLLGPNAGGSGPATRCPGPAYSHPCPEPPSRLRPARRSPRSSRFSGNQRAEESRLQAGLGRHHSRRHSSLTRGLSPRLRNEPSRGSRSGPPAGLANALGEGRLLPAVGSAGPHQRRSPGNRGSYTEAESRRA